MSKKQKLHALGTKIKKCQRCRLWKGAKHAVSGQGPGNAKIMMIGEAPGRLEDESGTPFVGPAGKFLDKTLDEFELKRRNIYITSVIKHRPPKNRDPRADELAGCRVWWQEQIKIINPKLVFTLGRIAAKEVIGPGTLKGKLGKSVFQQGIHYLPTYHPAAAMRFPKINRVFQKTLKKIKNFAV